MFRDVIRDQYRKALYDVLTLAALIFGYWQASNGHWDVFVGSVLTALTTRLASANTGVPKGPVDEFDDPETAKDIDPHPGLDDPEVA